MDSLLNALHGSAASWHEGKLFVEYLVAICHDTLHVYAGVAVWLFLALVLRRSIGDWLPLLGTAAIAILNEAVDLWVELWPSVGRQLGEGARDVLETIAIPALLFVLVRLRPSIGTVATRQPRANGTSEPNRVTNVGNPGARER